MEEPLLSIVIPFYNLEHWLLERCIRSIVEQDIDPADYEIIVVDDGSSNSPQPVTDAFETNDIRLYRQENRGLGGARNSGMKLSRGHYIFFIDSDDYLFEGTLRPCLDVLKNDAPDLLNFGFRVTDQQKRERISGQVVVFSPFASGAEYMYKHNVPGCAWLYLFRKALATDHQITFTEGIFHEDEEFTTKIYYHAGKLIASNLVMYAYYRRNDSIINRKGDKHLNKRFDDLSGAIRRLYEFKENNRSLSSDLQQKAIGRKINLLTGDFLICMVRKPCTLSYITCELNKLRTSGLYPLPRKNYSFKYNIFRRMANSKPGICLLYLVEWFRSKTSNL